MHTKDDFAQMFEYVDYYVDSKVKAVQAVVDRCGSLFAMDMALFVSDSDAVRCAGCLRGRSLASTSQESRGQ